MDGRDNNAPDGFGAEAEEVLGTAAVGVGTVAVGAEDDDVLGCDADRVEAVAGVEEREGVTVEAEEEAAAEVRDAV